MPARSERTTYSQCAHAECEEKVANHAWGRIKADDWFQQRDGTVWCPKHIPEWVGPWRERKARDEPRPHRGLTQPGGEPMPDMIATVSTSISKAELDVIDELVVQLNEDWPKYVGFREGAHTGRAGVLRAMLRHALDDVGDFKQWLREEEGKPVDEVDDPARTLGTDVTDTTTSTTTEEN